MTGFLDLLAGITQLVRDTINQSAEDWARLVEEHPLGAASLLDLAAARLEARAIAFRRQSGWRARRNRAAATKLRVEAERLRHGLSCSTGIPTK